MLQHQFQDKDILNLQINDIWKQSLYTLIGCDNTVLNVEQYISISLQQDKEFLRIGKVADVNKDKLEFDTMKIQYINKQRR